jgi:uncharacterized membrane protein YiaA
MILFSPNLNLNLPLFPLREQYYNHCRGLTIVTITLMAIHDFNIALAHSIIPLPDTPFGLVNGAILDKV